MSTLRIDGLTAPDVSSMVVARPDKVEIWDITESGLVHVTELAIWSNILALEKTTIPVSADISYRRRI